MFSLRAMKAYEAKKENIKNCLFSWNSLDNQLNRSHGILNTRWFLHQNDRAKKAFSPQQKVTLLPHSAWVRVSKPMLLHHGGRWLTWIITHYLNLGLATVSTSSSFVPPSFWRSICKEVLSPACRSDFVSNKKMRWCVRHRAVRHGGGLKNDPHISVLLFKLLSLCTMFIQWAAAKSPF